MLVEIRTVNDNEKLFILDGNLPSKNIIFNNVSEARSSELAKRLFSINGVVQIIITSEGLLIKLQNEMSWGIKDATIKTIINDYFEEGLPLMTTVQESHSNEEIIEQIKDLIERRIRPFVQQDGGDIDFVKFENGIVYVNMLGACQGCPSAVITLKRGVENLLKHHIPEVIEVLEIDKD